MIIVSRSVISDEEVVLNWETMEIVHIHMPCSNANEGVSITEIGNGSLRDQSLVPLMLKSPSTCVDDATDVHIAKSSLMNGDCGIQITETYDTAPNKWRNLNEVFGQCN